MIKKNLTTFYPTKNGYRGGCRRCSPPSSSTLPQLRSQMRKMHGAWRAGRRWFLGPEKLLVAGATLSIRVPYYSVCYHILHHISLYIYMDRYNDIYGLCCFKLLQLVDDFILVILNTDIYIYTYCIYNIIVILIRLFGYMLYLVNGMIYHHITI